MTQLVYIVRHGQTDWNAELRLQGQAETDLNALGRSQATANGHRLAALIDRPEDFDFVASPMQRTQQTMRLIRAAMGLSEDGYRTDGRLVEVHFGDWQGYTLAEVEANSPGATELRSRDKWGFQPPGPGGESYQHLLERIKPWFESIAAPTVCVTHGGIVRTLFRLVEGMAPADAAALDVVQDRVLRFQDGGLEWV